MVFRAESVSNELEVQNISLNEKNRNLKSTIQELKDKILLLETEFNDQDK